MVVVVVFIIIFGTLSFPASISTYVCWWSGCYAVTLRCMLTDDAVD